jgi:hypothetical protein
MNCHTCNKQVTEEDYPIELIDGSVAYYDDDCFLAQTTMLEPYDLHIGDRIEWRDTDDLTHTGSIVRITEEGDDCGHFVTLRNPKGGDDQVPMAMIEKVQDIHGNWIPFI